MQIALVVGTATSTVKHRSLAGCKLLVVQPFAIDGSTPDGEPVIAVDVLGAGPGERVLITSDGKMIREQLKNDHTPARWSVIALQDDPITKEATP
jgi:ethanolamine utilization protein EutN